MSYSVGQLHKYAVNLYKTLEEETGKNVGFSVVSNIRLASTKDRMDEYHQYAGVAQTIGVDVKFLSPEQVKKFGLCVIRMICWCNTTPRRWIYSASRFNTSFSYG